MLKFLDGIRPMGVSKHFNMALLIEKFNNGPFKLSREVSSDIVWDKLKSMYNLDFLDELEENPFPMEIQNYNLPEEIIVKQEVEEKEIKIEKVEVKAETPKPTTPQVLKETETSASKRDLTPQRKSEKESTSEVKRTLPKRTRQSTTAENQMSSRRRI